MSGFEGRDRLDMAGSFGRLGPCRLASMVVLLPPATIHGFYVEGTVTDLVNGVLPRCHYSLCPRDPERTHGYG